MSSHTPGPWRVGEYTAYYGWFIQENRDDISPVAGVQADREDCEEGAANARLIASAPDLLEACKVAYALLDLGVEDATYAEEDRVYDALEKAIAKAEGGS